MRLYKDYKENQEEAQRKAADKEALKNNSQKDIVIIYERGTSFKTKVVLLGLLLTSLLGLGYAVSKLVILLLER